MQTAPLGMHDTCCSVWHLTQNQRFVRPWPSTATLSYFKSRVEKAQRSDGTQRLPWVPKTRSRARLCHVLKHAKISSFHQRIFACCALLSRTCAPHFRWNALFQKNPRPASELHFGCQGHTFAKRRGPSRVVKCGIQPWASAASFHSNHEHLQAPSFRIHHRAHKWRRKANTFHCWWRPFPRLQPWPCHLEEIFLQQYQVNPCSHVIRHH